MHLWLAAVVLAMLTQLALLEGGRLGAILNHLVGLACGLLFPLLLESHRTYIFSA